MVVLHDVPNGAYPYVSKLAPWCINLANCAFLDELLSGSAEIEGSCLDIGRVSECEKSYGG